MNLSLINLLNSIFYDLIVVKSVGFVAEFRNCCALDMLLLSFTFAVSFMANSSYPLLILRSHVNSLSFTNTIICFVIAMECFKFVYLCLF